MRSRSKLSNNSTFYVDATNGNDANSGKSPGTAWKTIAKVNASIFNAGSLILFLGGTSISGAIALTNTNCPLGNVKLGSYGTGQATISSTTSAAISATNVPGVVVDGLICTGSGTGVNSTAGLVFTNSQSGANKLAGPTVDNCTISGYGYNGISIEGTSGNSGFNRPTIRNNTVHDCTGNSTDSFGTSAIQIFSKTAAVGTAHTDITVTGNTCYNLTGKTGGTNWLGSGITVSQCTGFMLAFNVVHDFGVNSSVFDPVGVWAYDAASGYIQFNEVYNGFNVADGIDLDQNCTDCIVQYNWCHDNAGYNYLASGASGASSWDRNHFRFNIGQNGGKGEFGFYFVSNAGTANVYNNTFVNFRGFPIFHRGSDTGTITGIVANNIIAGSGGNLLAMATPGSINFTGNDYYTYGTAFSISWNGSTYSSFAAWQTATGQEKISAVNVGLTSNPNIYVPGGGFTNGGYVPANLMAYNLQSGSAMIGTGLNLTTQFGINPGTQDYYGVAITASALPVGAAAGDFSSFVSTSTASSNFLARVSSFTKADSVNYDSLLSGLNSDGDLALIDALYILAAPNSAASLLNLVSTSYSLTANGTTTFTARTGIAGNGSTGYLDTGFTGNSGSPNFTQNSATIAVYNRTTTSPTVDHVLIGNSNASMYNDISVQVAGGSFLAVNEGGSFNGFGLGQGGGNSAGYLFAQRTAAAVAQGYYNGSSSGSGTTEASGSIASSTNMTLLAGNFGPVGSFSSEQVSAALIGGGAVSAARTSRRINSLHMAYGINKF